MESIDIGTLSVPSPVVWTHHVIEDAIVYADGGRRPHGHDTPRTFTLLPSYLARAGGLPSRRIGNVPALLKDLLDFYRAFGFLAPVERPLRAHGRRRRSIRSSESLAWALRHAWNVQTIIALHDARGDELDRLLAQLVSRPARVRLRVQSLAVEELITPGGIVVPSPRQSERFRRFMPERRQGEPALDFSRRIIDAFLTPNLVYIRRRYDPVEGVPRFVGEYLIDAVYWQLANDLTAGTLRQCPCGQLFFAQDKRQRVCPPLPGRRESRCGQRFRMQRKRAAALRRHKPVFFIGR